MKSILYHLVAAGIAAAPVTSIAAQEQLFTPDGMKAHISFLADDLLEGRETGSRGHEIAARYVASRFMALGLKPGGDNGGWFQRVTFQQTERTDTPGTLAITGPAGTQEWKHATEIMIGTSATEPKLDVAAPLVFAGYGIEDRLLGIDDYRGLDVKGRIVVVLSGYPKGLPSEEGAHASASKAEAAARHGAVGIITVQTLLSEKTRPWATRIRMAGSPRFAWVGADGKPFDDARGIRLTASVHGPAADAIFAGAPQRLSDILKEADRAKGMPKGFALKTSARGVVESRSSRVTSPNVVGILPGSDPTLSPQYVVLSAHLDHIGVSKPKPGEAADADHINNGALDNAAGIATMLEVARAAVEGTEKPRRSILFLASTAEEKGLLGADYFARHPTVPLKSIVGNVDLDMPLLLYPFTDVIAFGADHSTLGPLVAGAVAPMGVKLSADPMPAEGIFVRSDHYMFVKQGVPAVFLATGYANGGEAAWGKFLAGHYHQPGDDLSQPIDWKAAARFAEANYRITMAMANADRSPQWYAGDFFGATFAPDAAKAPKAGRN